MPPDHHTGTAMYFSYDSLALRYEPFPIGVARPLMEEALYRDFVAAFPPRELFAYLPKVGHKYVLSEKFNGRAYQDFVAARPLWREFHRWIKSEEFVFGLLDALSARHVDLGFRRPPPLMKRLRKSLRHGLSGRRKTRDQRLSARFEFSMLPAEGGHVVPHTDLPGKIVTLVVSMLAPGEWDPALGGGTDVNRAKDPRHAFNRMNRQAGFDDMEVVDSFPFEANQAVIFIKTFNSWHSVRPMRGGGPERMRKTLTINLEAF